jgi:hypothetical protein
MLGTFLGMKGASVSAREGERLPFSVRKSVRLFLFSAETGFFHAMQGGNGMSKYDAARCVALLRDKHAALLSAGIGRYPRRADFSEEQVVAIKAHLGPWPRALEAAGIKPPRDDDRAEKNKEKRIRAKRARIAALKEAEHKQKEK